MRRQPSVWQSGSWYGLLAAMWFLLAGGSVALAQSPTGPCASAAARAFDFWIGEWEIAQQILRPDGTWIDSCRHMYVGDRNTRWLRARRALAWRGAVLLGGNEDARGDVGPERASLRSDVLEVVRPLDGHTVAAVRGALRRDVREGDRRVLPAHHHSGRHPARPHHLFRHRGRFGAMGAGRLDRRGRHMANTLDDADAAIDSGTRRVRFRTSSESRRGLRFVQTTRWWIVELAGTDAARPSSGGA